MSERYCFDNGKIVALSEVKISPYDLGFLRGFAVFDVMRARGGKLIFGRNHFARFVQSAKTLGMVVPILVSEFETVTEALLAKNKMPEAVIRMVLTGGEAEDAMTFAVGKERMMILIESLHLPAAEIYTVGARAVTVDYQRELPEVKHANYMEAIMCQEQKTKARAAELIYVKDDMVTEASTSNIFIVRDGTIITPDKGILLGITRKFVIEIAQKNGFDVREQTVTKEQLFFADEVFLTATNKAVLPVTQIDGEVVGDGYVGETTQKLMTLFEEFCANQ